MSQKTVLLADDYEDARTILRRLLEMEGCRVFEAADGLEAVELAARYSSEIDLILMDLTMPGLDGYEATRRILAGEGTRHIPVVALSALCEQDTKSKAFEAGCSDCLPKPLDFKLIEELLERLPQRS
ncbi:MAG TPA: response regulator [Pyrinomonadaceae bacterium]|jgi:CheY-like chemotaxis protein